MFCAGFGVWFWYCCLRFCDLGDYFTLLFNLVDLIVFCVGCAMCFGFVIWLLAVVNLLLFVC